MNISGASTTENERAQLLLLSSYHHSARRILMALGAGLDIRNSREPNDSPTNNTDIVGLCGQGGRHRYFRVPEVRLRTAALEVMVANDLDTVAAVCQGLRRSTAFDDGTRCANDEVPSIVPLLPPEEIWFDNREMPLDVWRLLSFDIDLVSSGLSAHVPLDDIAFGSLTQTGLAFRAIMSRIQTGQVELIISGQNLSAAFPSGLRAC